MGPHKGSDFMSKKLKLSEISIKDEIASYYSLKTIVDFNWCLNMSEVYTQDNPPEVPPGWIAVWDEEYQTYV